MWRLPHESSLSACGRYSTATQLITVSLLPYAAVNRCTLHFDYTTVPTFTPAASGLDGLPAPNLRSASPLSVNLQSCSHWLEMLCWSNGVAIQLARELRGKERIDLSVVLGDQLIPIVCASTDSPMCLIWYGLFLLSQDKSLSHHFPLWAANQIKSKGMTACRGFLPRLWLADHNKKGHRYEK